MSIDFYRHAIYIIHRYHVDKEKNLPFGGLITKLAFKAKVSLWDNEPTMKMASSIFAIRVVKSNAMLSKKRAHTTESTSSPPEPSVPSSQVLEQLTLLSQKIDAIVAKLDANQLELEKDIVVVRLDCVQANNRLVQLSLDMQ